MPFYTGKSHDGSDIHEVEPFLYLSPDGAQWSNMDIYPGSKERKIWN